MARPAGGDVARRRRSDRRVAHRARGAAVSGTPQAAHVAAAAQLACLLEVSAPKPGNVSPFASFRDATYEDFLASAAAIGPALAAAGERPLGATIRAAVDATARWAPRSEEHTSELQSQSNLVCRLLLEKKKRRCDLCVRVGRLIH